MVLVILSLLLCFSIVAPGPGKATGTVIISD